MGSLLVLHMESPGVNAGVSGELTVQTLGGWVCKEHFEAGQEGLFQNAEAFLKAEKQFGHI